MKETILLIFLLPPLQRDKIYSLLGPHPQSYFNGPLLPELSSHWFLMSGFFKIILLFWNLI